jgi:hypothetical protein
MLFPEMVGSDGATQYILTKAPNFGNYTLCQLRTWLSADCSTHLSIGGTPQPALEAHCADTTEKAALVDESIGFSVSIIIDSSQTSVNVSNANIMFRSWALF